MKVLLDSQIVPRFSKTELTTENTGFGLGKFISAHRKCRNYFQQLHSYAFTSLDGLIVNRSCVERPKECCILHLFFQAFAWSHGRNERVKRWHTNVLRRDDLKKREWVTKPATLSEEPPKTTQSIQQHHFYIGVYCDHCSRLPQLYLLFVCCSFSQRGFITAFCSFHYGLQLL